MTNEEQKELTQQRLSNALLHLMSFETLNKISVTKLTREANVSRWAFYRNFNYIDEILIKYSNKLFHDFYQGNIINQSPINWEQFSLYIYRFIRKNGFFIQELYENEKSDIWFNAAVNESEKFFQKKLGHPVPKEKLLFLTGGIMALAYEWVKKDARQNINELASIINPQLQVILNDDKNKPGGSLFYK